MPPIETFMNVLPKMRKDHLINVNILNKFHKIVLEELFSYIYYYFKYIEHGDIVISKINFLSEAGLHMEMICFDNHKKRDLTGLKLDVS